MPARNVKRCSTGRGKLLPMTDTSWFELLEELISHVTVPSQEMPHAMCVPGMASTMFHGSSKCRL